MLQFRSNFCFLLAFSIILLSFDKIKKKKKGNKISSTIKYNNTNLHFKKSPYYIIIDKSDATLKVYDDKGWVKSYPVVFGCNDLGDKQMHGDKKTPNGTFRILNKKNNSKWGPEIMLDYPNVENYKNFNERKQKGLIPDNAKIGCCISIHGTNQGEDWLIDYGQNWTDGCISLKSDEVKDLYNTIPIGTTVTINKFHQTVKDFSKTNLQNYEGSQVDETGQIDIHDIAGSILKQNKIIKTVKVTREMYVREKSDIVKEPLVVADSYWNTLQQARVYFNMEDWLNAKKFYTAAQALNTESELTDTINIIDGFFKYDSALGLATKAESEACKRFNLTGLTTADEKILLCNESIVLYEKAIIAYDNALQFDPKGRAPGVHIRDCGEMIEKIKKEFTEIESRKLYDLYRISKEKGKDAADKKDYNEALKDYEEALRCLQNENVQKLMYNPIDEISYLKIRLEIMRYRVTLESNDKNVNQAKQ